MKNGKYETALKDYIPANVKEWQPIHEELLNAAGTIDHRLPIERKAEA